MSNKLTDAYAFAGSPVRLSGLAQSVHALLLHRFDERPIVNGRPNKGYRKSYPSMEEMQTWCTGFTRQAVNKALEELIAKGFIIRVEIGRPGPSIDVACAFGDFDSAEPELLGTIFELIEDDLSVPEALLIDHLRGRHRR